MEKLFILFMAAMMIAAGLIIIYETATGKPNGANTTEIQEAHPTTAKDTTETTQPKTTAIRQATIDLEPTTTIQETTTTAKSPPTTTTPASVIQFEVFRADNCRDTVLGKMNTVYLRLNATAQNLSWSGKPDPKFTLSCDGAEPFHADYAYAKGEGPIQPYSEVAGEYRLAVRCGRNSGSEDLSDCGTVKAYLDIQSVGMEAAEPTATTLTQNPYLDRFRGKGYRMARFHVAWLCPSCVPAVNKLVMETPGVKSRSLAYGQKIGYVIYDPTVLSLDEVLEAAGAGGDLEDITDGEI